MLTLPRRGAVGFSVGLVLAAAVFAISLPILTASVAHAESLIYTCTAETQNANALSISDVASCTVPGGVTITRASLDTTLDDGGEVYVDNNQVFSAPNDPAMVRQNTTDVSVGFSAGQNFILKVNARNDVDAQGNGIGPVYGKAVLNLYGNQVAAPPQTHKACQSNACVVVSGAGSDQCSADSQCTAAPAQISGDIKCNGSDGPCTVPVGGGTQISWTSQNANMCKVHPTEWAGTSGSQPDHITQTTTYQLECWNATTQQVVDTVTVNVTQAQTHKACQSNACVVVSGAGSDQCSADSQCTAAPAQLTCTPAIQTVSTNQSASFSASGGTGNFIWSAPGANTPSGSGASFSTAYPFSGSYGVAVLSGNQTTQCNVTVQNTVTAAPTADIKANGSDSPITITSGQSATITWASSNATQCTISPTGWAGTTGTQQTGALSNTQTYTLTCTGTGGTATDSVTVNVQNQTGLSCSASTYNPGINQSVFFTATGGNGSYNWNSGGNPSNGTGGTYSTSFSNGGNQTVTVQSNGQSAQCSVFVNGSSYQQPTVTLTANPTYVNQGQTVYLTWYSTNANTCYASGGWSGNEQINGSQNVNPSFTTTYIITCSNNYGVATSQQTVTVNNNNCYNNGNYNNNCNCQNGYNNGGYNNGYNNCNTNATNLQVTKLVYNRTLNNAGNTAYGTGNFTNQTDAQGLDVLEFQIDVRNIDVNSGSVMVRDLLPSELYYVLNSTTLDGSPVQDGITTGGLSLGIVYPNQDHVIRFRATVFSGISDRTITNQVTATMNAGVQNSFATINIRNRGQVLGAADIVTGPEDVLPWVLGLGFLGSLMSYFIVFKFRLIPVGAQSASSGPISDLQKMVFDLRAEEKGPDTERLKKK